MSLRRRLAISPEVQQPAWARPEEAHQVLPALLVGRWSDKGDGDGDREVLAALAARPYEDVARDLTRWANASDPPVRRVGTTWYLVSQEDAWALLARFLTVDDLQRFKDVVLGVLGATDPALDLPPDQRWMADVLGRARPQSGRLRKGLADTVAMMGARSAQTSLAGDGTAQAHADRIVHDLLTRANADQTGGVWSSVSDVLPLLAEASPRSFLAAVDAGLASDEPVLRHEFADADQPAAFATRPPHTGLLWALETLAWAPDYLGRAALRLAGLARLDPGGQLANGSVGSLTAIFLPYYPQTTASLEQRLDALDALRDREPDVAWRLMVSLLPKTTGVVAFPTHAPRWREWKPESTSAFIRDADWPRALREVVTRLLDDVDANASRWRDLIDAVGALTADLQDAVIEHLSAVDMNAVDEPGRAGIRDALRATIAKHRRFAHAHWAMPAAQVDRLAEAHQRFESDDPARRHAWLFASHPKLLDPGEGNRERYRQAVDEARDAAAQAIYQQGGLPALVELAAAVQEPAKLGRAAGRTGQPPAEEDQLLADLVATNEARRQLARGYVAGRFASAGWAWAEGILQRQAPAWTPEQRTGFLAILPREARAWDCAARLDPTTEHTYWAQFGAWGLAEPSDATSAATKLLEHGRPFAAVDLLGIYLDQAPDPGLVADALDRAAQAPADGSVDPAMLVHYVTELLNYLEASGAVDDARAARLEWAYLPLLQHGGRPPALLHRELAHDPAFFAEVASWVYQADDEEPREPTEEEFVRAQLGGELLDSWREVPGRRDAAVDADTLAAWVQHARELLAGRGRRASGDAAIGRMLRHGPPEAHGAWPDAAIRSVIEDTASRDLEDGFMTEVLNTRGVTTRGLTDGGTQERQLAERYHAYASAAGNRWPRTAALLAEIAGIYEADAQREDVEAELTEDLWT